MDIPLFHCHVRVPQIGLERGRRHLRGGDGGGADENYARDVAEDFLGTLFSAIVFHSGPIFLERTGNSWLFKW